MVIVLLMQNVFGFFHVIEGIVRCTFYNFRYAQPILNKYSTVMCALQWGLYLQHFDVYSYNNVLILAQSERKPSVSDCPVFLDIAIPSVKITYILYSTYILYVLIRTQHYIWELLLFYRANTADNKVVHGIARGVTMGHQCLHTTASCCVVVMTTFFCDVHVTHYHNNM